ncbi:MAG: ornithine carbamoyltransferase [Actinobacteria bacterium]|nr:ornithine carbamoyltransferase [Actinomycetota bacterium]
MTRHFLDITDVNAAELTALIDAAKRPSEDLGRPLAAKGVALIFEKPSNRTRHSSEMAVVQLGGHPVYTRGEEIGFDVRESVEDIGRILAGYHAIVAVRVFSHSTLQRLAAVSDAPIVNLLSDHSHPLQACADVLTMQQHVGPISDLRVAWLGDYNNVARSLGEAVCLLGGSMSFGCPEGFAPESAELSRLSSLGGSVSYDIDPAVAVTGADVIHTDTWVSMGQESDAAARHKVFVPYGVTEQLMMKASKGAKFMHCMPAHRGEEVSAEVFDGPRSLVIEQGHNRMHAARAVFAFVSGGGK